MDAQFVLTNAHLDLLWPCLHKQQPCPRQHSKHANWIVHQFSKAKFNWSVDSPTACSNPKGKNRTCFVLSKHTRSDQWLIDSVNVVILSLFAHVQQNCEGDFLQVQHQCCPTCAQLDNCTWQPSSDSRSLSVNIAWWPMSLLVCSPFPLQI